MNYVLLVPIPNTERPIADDDDDETIQTLTFLRGYILIYTFI